MTRLLRTLAAVFLCAGFVALSPARAGEVARGELIEGIDIERRGNEALITIRFAVAIEYSRHSPADAESGATLRIYPGIPGAEEAKSRGMMRLPDTDMVPNFTVTYPEPDGALLIEFEQPTRFEVNPNSHSVTVTIPVLPGARDWVVITKDWSLSPVDMKPRILALAAELEKQTEVEEVEQAEAEAQLVEPEPRFEPTAYVTGFGGGGSGSYSVRLDSMKSVRFGTIVRQQQDWSCGSAAVATLLTYHYNHPVSETEALEAMYARGNQAKIRREGFSLLDIKNYLESIGYQANGFETSLERLARVKVPAIVIINDSGYNHFVVVKGLRHGNVLLGDPAKGNRVISRQTFEQMWENKIVFVITSRRDGVAFNFSEDWRFVSAPLGDALSRDSLGALLMTRQGRNDF
jgi:predicted double-glycine peptidase